MHWKLKANIQKILQYVPFGKQIHYQLQKHGGGLKNFEHECTSKIDDWALMAGHLQNAGIPLAGSVFMEIGTGWYPTLPTCLYLTGAARVLSVDLNSHLRVELVKAMLDVVGRNLQKIQQYADDPALVNKRFDTLKQGYEATLDIEKASEGVIKCVSPADAARTGFADNSIDLIFSNSVFEHIPGPIIRDILKESWRIVKNGGAIFHSINCGDHYSYIDRSINQLHYLQYSEEEWRWWTNDFLYQNRLRAKDFLDMIRSAGFNIQIDTSVVKEQRLQQLAEIKVASCFSGYTPEELCLTTVDIVARKN